MKVFNDFVNKSRRPEQDLHQYVADFQDDYNKLELLKNANLPDTEFKIIASNLDFSSEEKAKSLLKIQMMRSTNTKIVVP